MAVLEITARQFRDKQKNFFEIADTGRQVVIKRGRKQSYILTPVHENDFVATPELLERLDNIRQRVKNGEYTECKTIDEALQHLETFGLPDDDEAMENSYLLELAKSEMVEDDDEEDGTGDELIAMLRR